jgi:CheY-like chemotaxis protein
MILVVEDEPLIRLGVVSTLEDAGFETLDAPNADRAIELLEAHPQIRFVITDVDMPGTMDGLKLAAYVRNKWPPIKLIVISGKVGVTPEQLPEGVRFLAKPYREPQLLGLIRLLDASGAT